MPKYHCAFQDMQEIFEDYHDQNPHLPLPQLLWPDFAFPASIYDPTKWCDRDRYSQLDENGEVPSWLSITATQLAPPLDSLNNDELNSNSADSVHPDRERDSCKKTTQINFSSSAYRNSLEQDLTIDRGKNFRCPFQTCCDDLKTDFPL